MSFLTDHKRVAGLGSAKSGTGHFMQQRVTAIALIPLTILFLYTFIGALGSGHEAVLETYSHPIPALVAIMFIWVMFSHLRLGLQVVIEDYIPNHRIQMVMLILNALIWRGAAIVGLFAIARIAL